MLIKNNKIIVRKCTKETAEKLCRNGYEKYSIDGKTLIIPFHVFDEYDLMENLTSLGIKFYGVPLSEESYCSLRTNNYSLLDTFNMIFENDDRFKENVFTDTIELIRNISKNKKSDHYDKLILELKSIVKNPMSLHSTIDLTELSNFLADNLDDLSLADKERLKNIENNLKSGYRAHMGNDFLNTCVFSLIYEPILQEYKNADLVFWYNVLPDAPQSYDILKNS